MTWAQLSSIAIFGVVIGLAIAAASTLAGLDRWLDERRNRRARDRFDIFHDGGWRE